MDFLLLITTFAFALRHSTCFPQNIENPTAIHLDTIIQILARINLQVSVIFDPEADVWCENVIRFLSREMSVNVFNSNYPKEQVFSKLNLLCFRSYENFHLFETHRTWLANAYYVVLTVEKAEVQRILPTLRTTHEIRRAILLSNFTTEVYRVSSSGVQALDLHNVTEVTDLFGEKNFGGQPLRITQFQNFPDAFKATSGEFMGWNYKMMRLAAEYWNFTPMLVDSTDGKKHGEYVNGTYTGGLGDIAYGRSDIAMNGYLLREISVQQKFRYTWPVNQEYVCIGVPRAEQIPKYLTPLTCFTPMNWFIIANTMMTVCCVRCAIAYVGWKFIYYKKVAVVDTILTTLSASINIPLAKSQYRYAANRVVLFLYFGSMFIIIASLQAFLVTLLSIPKHYKDINTLEELKDSGLEIRTSSLMLVQAFKEDPLLSQLSGQLQWRAASLQFKDFNFSFLWTYPVSKKYLFTGNFFTVLGNRTYEVHALPDCPLRYYTSYVIPIDFPFTDELNIFIMRVIEGGFIQKWDDDVLENNRRNKSSGLSKGLRYKELLVQNRTFSLEDLEIAFFILIAGLTLSLIVFVGEIRLIHKVNIGTIKTTAVTALSTGEKRNQRSVRLWRRN